MSSEGYKVGFKKYAPWAMLAAATITILAVPKIYRTVRDRKADNFIKRRREFDRF